TDEHSQTQAAFRIRTDFSTCQEHVKKRGWMVIKRNISVKHVSESLHFITTVKTSSSSTTAIPL
ncbi:hypothetical protein J6590_077303, partial [Homalodisca vitripennis]